jgi:hypothetical protein
MAITHPIPVDVLRQLLRLDPETGRLYWRERGPEWFKPCSYHDRAVKIWNIRFAGKEAFNLPRDRNRGYLRSAIFGRFYYAHSVVFALTHGRWSKCVDHIDRDPANNHPSNLRDATKAQNAANSPGHADAVSRFRGVTWSKKARRWVAKGRDDTGRCRSIGSFVDEEAAARAADGFHRERHGAFAYLNFPD